MHSSKKKLINEMFFRLSKKKEIISQIEYESAKISMPYIFMASEHVNTA